MGLDRKQITLATVLFYYCVEVEIVGVEISVVCVCAYTTFIGHFLTFSKVLNHYIMKLLKFILFVVVKLLNTMYT